MSRSSRAAVIPDMVDTIAAVSVHAHKVHVRLNRILLTLRNCLSSSALGAKMFYSKHG